MNEKISFLRNHADTLAIIGVNLAIAAIYMSILISNISSIQATNSRIDTMYVMFYDLLNQVKK
jgi:hypothetical protein